MKLLKMVFIVTLTKMGKYKGGLYTYADEKNPSIKNLKELSAADDGWLYK